ncbi:MAG TPA: hypothetical protein VGD64_08555 [Acidisarcina sp.]
MYETEDEFEQELRDGLRPRQAPEGFADRVIALSSVGTSPAQRDGARPGQLSTVEDPLPAQAVLIRRQLTHSGRLTDQPLLRWAIAATLLISIAFGGYAERQRQIAGERARQQVLLALRITGSTLRAVHNRIADGND